MDDYACHLAVTAAQEQRIEVIPVIGRKIAHGQHVD